MGKQETVTAFPFRLICADVHGVAVGNSQYVGPAQRLADITLALYFTHAQGETSDSPGMGRHPGKVLIATLGHIILHW
ncbi:hypothetical protein D3C79_715070 [compost metagenome]